MRFSAYMSPRSRSTDDQRPLLQAITDQALQADEHGFDAVFLTEHHMSTHNPFQNSLLFGSYLAPQLQQAYVGLSVANIAVHQPVRFVESCNLLDQLTRGRTIIGVGTGLVPGEFLAFGRDPATRGPLFEETLEVLLDLWSFQPGDDPYTFSTSAEHGVISQPVTPAPFRPGHPLLAHATATPAKLIRAANYGWPVLFANLHAGDVQKTVQVYWDTLEQANLPTEVLADCLRWTGFLKRIYVAETDAEAERHVRGPIERLVIETAQEDAAAAAVQPVENRFGVGRSVASIMQNSVIYGSPSTVIERIREYEATGIEQMMAMFIWDAQFLEHSARSFNLFLNEVQPCFTAAGSRHVPASVAAG
jgi:alkanesulfonate monooxygenase SsuD/methylene tetrahydromethanopterin reductase-like flavin-dependent oxidoreductase (luciferase family)